MLRSRPKELYRISSKGTVPVLLLSDGKVIDESIDIMKWAIIGSNSNWYNIDIEFQNELIKYNDTEFKKRLDRYKYHSRYPENSIEYYRNKCVEELTKYDSLLVNNNYLLGDKIQLVDVALFPFIRQFANVDRAWFSAKFVNLERWLENWIQSNLFKSVMCKYDVWKSDDKPNYIIF